MLKIGSKTWLKLYAVIVTIYQGYALYLNQPFNPLLFASALGALYGQNSLHEKYVQPCQNNNTEQGPFT